jgi:hypothetical protein
MSKHRCWSCIKWRTCEDVHDGAAEVCERWHRRTYREIFESCQDGSRYNQEFIDRVIKVHGFLFGSY